MTATEAREQMADRSMVNRPDAGMIAGQVSNSAVTSVRAKSKCERGEGDWQRPEHRLADLEGHLAVLLPQLSVASFALTHARQERDEIRAQLATCSEEHERRVSDLLQEREDLQAQLDVSSTALASALQRVAEGQEEVSRLAEAERKLVALEIANAEMVEEREGIIGALRDACDSLERQVQDLKTGQAERAALLERRFAEAVGARDTRIAALSAEARRHEASHRQLRERHDQLAAEVDDLRNTAQQAVADRAEAQRAMVHCEELLREQNSELEELRRELAEARAQASVAVAPNGRQAARPVEPRKIKDEHHEPRELKDEHNEPRELKDEDHGWTDSFEPDMEDWSRTPPPDAVRERFVGGKRRG